MRNTLRDTSLQSICVNAIRNSGPPGIAMIRDRGAQTVAVWVFGTICEADLPATQCGYQHQRSACKAVRQVHCLLNTSHRKGVDADLTVYYESIPHRELRKSAVRRVCDQQVLHLSNCSRGFGV